MGRELTLLALYSGCTYKTVTGRAVRFGVCVLAQFAADSPALVSYNQAISQNTGQ